MAYKMLYLARRAKDVAWEDWPRTWKSHAIFASQFPAMDGTIDWMRYTTRVDDPRIADLPVSTEHDGVSVAEAPVLDTFYGRGFSKEQRALIDQDELRVFDRYTPEFSFWAKESRAVDGPVGEAAIFRFLARKPGTSREAFDQYLQDDYGRLCRYWSNASREAFDQYLQDDYGRLCRDVAPALGAQRWALNSTVDGPPEDFPFEAIDECWFADVDAAIAAFGRAEMARLPEALARVCDMDRGITMLTRPTHRWPRVPR